MKSMMLVVVVSFLMLSCATTGTIENAGAQSEFLTESEDMNIKVVGPEQPMAAPSKNERAMRAYTTGTIFLRENNLNEAEKYLKEAIELDPLFVDAMDHLGMVYRRQNRFDEAEEMYLRSIGINDKNILPYQNLAVVYRINNLALKSEVCCSRKVVTLRGLIPF